jgi:histidine triad (HIT) family protein
MDKDCIFCKIVKGKVPTNKIIEMKNVLAFYDIDPSADTHILIIPKIHINSFLDIKKEHSEILNQMLKVAQDLVKAKKIESKYKLVINGGKYQFVPHLHLHLLGGEMKKKV